MANGKKDTRKKEIVTIVDEPYWTIELSKHELRELSALLREYEDSWWIAEILYPIMNKLVING